MFMFVFMNLSDHSAWLERFDQSDLSNSTISLSGPHWSLYFFHRLTIDAQKHPPPANSLPSLMEGAFLDYAWKDPEAPFPSALLGALHRLRIEKGNMAESHVYVGHRGLMLLDGVGHDLGRERTDRHDLLQARNSSVHAVPR